MVELFFNDKRNFWGKSITEVVLCFVKQRVIMSGVRGLVRT